MVEATKQNQISDAETVPSEASSSKLRFPIGAQLVTLVRTLDGFNDSQLIEVRNQLFSLALLAGVKQDSVLAEEPKAVRFLQMLLKLHQVLALLDVDYSKASTDPTAHLTDIARRLKNKGGLDYTPRERTPQGRVFEHAADSRTLLSHLLTFDNSGNATEEVQPTFWVGLLDDSESLFNLNEDFIELTLNANGKAELYFHAYFWTTYFNKIAEKSGEDHSAFFSSPEVVRLSKLSSKPQQVFDTIKRFPFGEEQYNKLVADFGGRAENVKKVRLIEELQRALFAAQIQNNEESLGWIERILIQLLGYREINIRDQAVVLLNMLYDGVDWQLSAAFRPIVRCIGQHFKVHLTVNIQNFDENKDQLFLGLSAPSPLESTNETVLTWHKIGQRNILKSDDIQTEVHINFGKFWKCGFYDWRLIHMSNDGKLNTVQLTQPPKLHSFPLAQAKSTYADEMEIECDMYDVEAMMAQGRFIIQARGLRDQTFHEVQIDYQNGEVDWENQTFLKRGTFADVEQSMSEYSQSGVTALYLMGVFQRDNMPVPASQVYFRGLVEDEKIYKKVDASPLAVTSRDTPCEMLGGAPGFDRVMKRAKQENVKIIVDCLARISSSRHHRKFKELLLHYLDDDGRRRICYGTDGHAQKYEETAMLNYRKKESWDLLVAEVLSFASRTGVDGIHLDNGQAWPQIMEVDMSELLRVDDDGEPAYTAEDVMNGEIVLRNENFGYWNTNTMEQHANPFFSKLCRQLWAFNPNFMIIGECWGGFKFEHRQIILSRSGVIPRLYKLPQAISGLFGKKLHRDGRIVESEKEGVESLRRWYDEAHHMVPEGTIMLQSSTAHSWPYPAYLYGKGTWAAVDILYFLPDVPITFMGEVDGHVYRIGSGSVFQHEQTMPLGGGVRKVDSSLGLALNKAVSIVETPHESKASELGVKIRSQSDKAALRVESQNSSGMQLKEDAFKKEMGLDFGFDLSKIKSHYEHRRQLRREKMVLRYGQLAPLLARSDQGDYNERRYLDNVLSFARYSLMETAIISVNLSDEAQNFYVDMENLLKLTGKGLPPNTVIIVSNLLEQDHIGGNDIEYYFFKEFCTMKHWQKLLPYASSIQLITICNQDKFIFQKALTRSIERTRDKLIRGDNIEAEQISHLLTDCLSDARYTDVAYFANIVGSLQESFLDRINMSLNDLFLNNQALKQDPVKAAKFMGLCKQVATAEGSYGRVGAPARACKLAYESNQLGPIVFCTPELGRWSTVGGLGVMVDELALGLAKLGRQVIVISPYYERNRKGKTGYLAEDPAGIHYIDNIQVKSDHPYSLGVHEGIVGNVKVVFLHNGGIFPSPYADLGPAMTIRQMSVFAKGCLEYCCKRQIIPSVCVTNDWFTAFTAAYAKIGAFGPTFKGTTFLHICHNLQESYEGRIYPGHADGWFEPIHQLPRDWLIDPSWSKIMINPSRCAIMLSDQWATVSKSYRQDLLNSSPLRAILHQKEKPFAFPNGIPIEDRLKRLDAKAPDHLTAKKILQQKYFNFGDLDDSIPLFAFVGRVTEQKGVHMILDIAEHIIHKFNYKVQFIVGGPANFKDPYGRGCADRMNHLKYKYPHCFWAAPDEFFLDGSTVNRGADFGLMPSLFEPGGIVQHEFFVGCTPVIAYKTGGLKDSVIEYQWSNQIGTGYTFEAYETKDFIFAVERAIGTFNNKSHYNKLRENAFRGTMSGEVVSKAWLGEFCRLRGKVYTDYATMEKQQKAFKPWSPDQYQPVNIFDSMFGSEMRSMFDLDDIDFGAEESKEHNGYNKKVISEFDKIQKSRQPTNFMLHNRGPRHHKVQLIGSFDNWDTKYDMRYDNITNQWFITLHLARGDYFYKYVIDERHWVVNEEEDKAKDKAGNLNNYKKV